MKISLIILSLFLFTDFGLSQTKNVENEIIYSIDKDGIYIYNCSTEKTEKIYTSDKIFLASSLQSIDTNNIIVGHQSTMREEEKPRLVYSKYFYRVDGDSSFVTDNPPYTVYDKYKYVTESFFAININDKNSYKFKTLDYEHKEYDTLKIKETYFSINQTILSEFDTLTICNGTSSSSKGIRFCDFKRFYAESESVKGKKVISCKGDLILIENKQEEIILKYDGNFDPKFGSGYYNPTLSPDGTKVIYQYLAGFLKNGSGIFELDLNTKKIKKIIGSGYFDPKYSPNGNFIMLGKNQRQAKFNTWIDDIYILNLNTGKKKKIGEGDIYIWKK